jgi:hypothetical protein
MLSSALHKVHCCSFSSARPPTTTRSCVVAAAHQPRQQQWQRQQAAPASDREQQQHKHQSKPHNKQHRQTPSRFADKHQLNGLHYLVTEHCHKLAPDELVLVFLRAAKLRPLPRLWQQEQLLQPTWTALRSQLAACKVSPRHPALNTTPDCLIPSLTGSQALAAGSCTENVPSELVLSAVQAYEVVMVMWAAAKLGYPDPGALLPASCLQLQVLTFTSPSMDSRRCLSL